MKKLCFRLDFIAGRKIFLSLHRTHAIFKDQLSQAGEKNLRLDVIRATWSRPGSRVSPFSQPPARETTSGTRCVVNTPLPLGLIPISISIYFCIHKHLYAVPFPPQSFLTFALRLLVLIPFSSCLPLPHFFFVSFVARERERKKKTHTDTRNLFTSKNPRLFLFPWACHLGSHSRDNIFKGNSTTVLVKTIFCISVDQIWVY